MKEIQRSRYFVLSAENIAEVVELMDAILRYPCAVTTIVKDLSRVETWANVTAEIVDGRACRVLSDELSPWVSWSIGGWSYGLHLNDGNPVKISWRDGQLRIDQRAPAGHPLVWLFCPDRDATPVEP